MQSCRLRYFIKINSCVYQVDWWIFFRVKQLGDEKINYCWEVLWWYTMKFSKLARTDFQQSVWRIDELIFFWWDWNGQGALYMYEKKTVSSIHFGHSYAIWTIHHLNRTISLWTTMKIVCSWTLKRSFVLIFFSSKGNYLAYAHWCEWCHTRVIKLKKMKDSIHIWKERHDGIQAMLCINQAGVNVRKYRACIKLLYIYFTMYNNM